MKIIDIIREERNNGKIPSHQVDGLQGAIKFRDRHAADRIHNLYQVMNAAAMADGLSDDVVDMDKDTWHSKYNTAHPYTDLERRMLNQAFKTIDTDHQVVSPDTRSHEHKEIHKTSPVRDRGHVALQIKNK